MPEFILIVEDEPSLQETLAYNLKKDGYAVETVGDGLSALEAARRLRPDLIILDIMLPKMDGFEVARILRKELTTAILMLTRVTMKLTASSVSRSARTITSPNLFRSANCWRASKRNCGARACCAKRWERQTATPLPHTKL